MSSHPALLEDLDLDTNELPELIWRTALVDHAEALDAAEASMPAGDLELLARLRGVEGESEWGRGPDPP